MGLAVRLVLYAPDEDRAKAAGRAAFARIRQLDACLSDWRVDSELNRLSASAGGAPVPVSADLFTVLAAATEMARRSSGAFDATVGPLVALWRRARREGVLPAPADLAAARALVGWRHLRLDATARTAQLALPGMRLDLGGIAKGYVGDEALATLRAHGVTQALYEAGGEIVVGDAPPGAAGWVIELADGERVTVANRAVSASGDTAQFVVIRGTRYSHVVDPHTGLGLTTRLNAHVLAPDGMTADALATAVTVLGPDAGGALAATWPGVRCWLRAAEDPPPRLWRERSWRDRGLL